jgi:DNA-binding transcriptional ArsR family regulator
VLTFWVRAVDAFEAISSFCGCVTELAELEDNKMTTISGRLQMLHGASLVRRRRKAKHIYYSLSDSHVLHLVESTMEHAAEKQ